MIDHLDGCPVKMAGMDVSYCICGALRAAAKKRFADLAPLIPRPGDRVPSPGDVLATLRGVLAREDRLTLLSGWPREDFPPSFKLTKPLTIDADKDDVWEIGPLKGTTTFTIAEPGPSGGVMLSPATLANAVPAHCPVCESAVSRGGANLFACENGHHVRTVAEVYRELADLHLRAEREAIPGVEWTPAIALHFGPEKRSHKIPVNEPVEAAKARALLTSPQTRIERVRVDEDPLRGPCGTLRVHVVATIDKRAASDALQAAGPDGGAGDRTIAEAARRATGETEPVKVAERLAEMARDWREGETR